MCDELATTDLGCYEQLLRNLPSSGNWAQHLDMMAASADTVSLVAEVRDDETGARKWEETALLLRAVAAANRGYILSDPCGAAEWLTVSCHGWAALVWGVTCGTSLERAESLHALYEVIAPYTAAALVLDDIAAAEMAVVRLRGHRRRAVERGTAWAEVARRDDQRPGQTVLPWPGGGEPR
jgi:hypothetical protein